MKRHSLSDKLSDLKKNISDKLKDTHLNDAKVHLTHKKHQIGKLGNLFNSNHRHDEEHEQACDDKRTAICNFHRYQSFFPERAGNQVKWYVDGRDYFWAVSEALERARETIYIADWWLSPELFLRRPPHDNAEWRLDKVLKRRAEAGVKIYVIVYREVEAALTCNSQHTKHALHALCPDGTPGAGNIRVMRHPDHNVLENAADMTFYWSHHEKFIVIDYELAFVGGLDLCFGRWDLHQHSLADAHPEGVANEIWPGQDFNNNRVLDFQNVQDWKQNELNKAEYGRMPWHDVSMAIIGPAVYDVAEHFVLRWNFVKRDKYKRDERYDWITLQGREGDDENLIGVQRPKHAVGEYVNHPLTPLGSKGLENRGTIHCQVVRSSDDWSSGVLNDHSIQNAYAENIAKARHFVYIENQFFITATGDRQLPIHNTIGRAIVDAVVRADRDGRRFRIIVLIPGIPGFAGDLRDDAATGTRAVMDYQFKSICRGDDSIFGQVRAAGVDPTKYLFFFNLRSYDRLNKTPAIDEAQRRAGVDYQQVQRAQAEEVMAEGIHGTYDPGEGEGDSHMGSELEQKKDGNGQQSEKMPNAKERFEQAKPDSEMRALHSIAHHAMAGTGKLEDEPWDDENLDTEVRNWIQEELYIHSKLLIVDDRIVVCGSSNLNDRSQVGGHDSELSVVMEDTSRVRSIMDGVEFEAGRHATSLRRYLWREHLGLLPPQRPDASGDIRAMPPGWNADGGLIKANKMERQGGENALGGEEQHDEPLDGEEGGEGGREDGWDAVVDPLGEKVWEMWTERATANTNIFRQLFHADPDDNVKTFDDYDRFLPARGVKSGHIYDQFIPAEEVRTKLSQIKGHLVWMPLDFLKEAEMAEKGMQVNQFTESVYT